MENYVIIKWKGILFRLHYIYIYIKVKLATPVEGDLKAPFLIATRAMFKGGC